MRYIKPSFWTDSKIVVLSPWARLLFIGMWNFAECGVGHLSDDPHALKRMVLPDDDVDAVELVDELVGAGVVARLQTVGGRKYLHIVHFADHQQLDKRWSPTCNVCNETRPHSPNYSDTHQDSRTLSDSHQSDGDTHGKTPKEGRGGEGKRTSSTAARSTGGDADFVRFWEVYPRKVGKGEARKAWAKLMKAGVDHEVVIAGAARYRDDPLRKRRGDEYTKHPGPWLNAERWDDQPADGQPAVDDEYEPPKAPREIVFSQDPQALSRWHAEQRAKWEASRSS